MKDNLDLFLQKDSIDRKYSFAKCEIKNDTLNVALIVDSELWKHKYSFGIFYKPSQTLTPFVKVIQPKIIPCPNIHMQKDGTLCLFNPVAYPVWKIFSIAEEIIPWSYKWAHYYEIWLINGNKWVGPEIPHGIFLPRDYNSRMAFSL